VVVGGLVGGFGEVDGLVVVYVLVDVVLVCVEVVVDECYVFVVDVVDVEVEVVVVDV